MKKKFFCEVLITSILIFVIFISSCAPKSVFQSIDKYIKKAGDSNIAILNCSNFSFFGTEIYDDKKIHCAYRGSNEAFQLSLREDYKDRGIYFFYYEQEKAESPLVSPIIKFQTKGFIYPKPYSDNQEIDFSSDVPLEYQERIVALFESFLSTLDYNILKPCKMTLQDFGYSMH